MSSRAISRISCARRRRLAALAVVASVCLAGCGRSAGPGVAPTSPLGSSLFAPAGASVVRTETVTVDTTGQAIARLRADVSPSDFAASYGTTAVDYIPELDLVLLRAPRGVSAATFAERLSTDSRVEFAEPDTPIDAAETRQSSIAFSEGLLPWSDVADQDALRRIGAAAAQQVTRGAGVLVAILDTGIELDHPALEASLSLPGIEFGVTTDAGDDRAEGVDTNGDGLVDGALGHGTHVAGIVHAVAPEAQLLPVRVLDSDGVGDAFGLARGLVASTNRGAAIANMSLGMSEVSRSVEAAIDYASAHGVVVVAPTGNGAAPTLEFPASDMPVVAVAATDSLDRRASFSNYGSGVDLAAPGVGILSTYVNRGYAVWSGTSMSAPFVSGVGALLYSLAGPHDMTALANVEQCLRSGAQSLSASDPQYADLLGSGRVSASTSVSTFLRIQVGASSPADPGIVRTAP